MTLSNRPPPLPALARLTLAGLAALPAWCREGLAALLAALYYFLPNRRRRIAGANLEGARFASGLTVDGATLYPHLRYRARALLTVGRLLHTPLDILFDEIKEIEGLERLTVRTADDRGVLMIAPHLGYWELFSLFLSAQVRAAIVYRPPAASAVEALLRAWRGRAGVEMLPATAAGLRRAYQRLAAGGIVGLLPDQKPAAGHAITIDFLGRPTPVSPLAARLARHTHCRLLAGACVREGAGYRLRVIEVEPADKGGSQDEAIMAAVFGAIEKLIALAPEQYQWSYRLWPSQPAAASLDHDTPPGPPAIATRLEADNPASFGPGGAAGPAEKPPPVPSADDRNRPNHRRGTEESQRQSRAQ